MDKKNAESNQPLPCNKPCHAPCSCLAKEIGHVPLVEVVHISLALQPHPIECLQPIITCRTRLSDHMAGPLVAQTNAVPGKLYHTILCFRPAFLTAVWSYLVPHEHGCGPPHATRRVRIISLPSWRVVARINLSSTCSRELRCSLRVNRVRGSQARDAKLDECFGLSMARMRDFLYGVR